jgi:hypothetical protein
VFRIAVDGGPISTIASDLGYVDAALSDASGVTYSRRQSAGGAPVSFLELLPAGGGPPATVAAPAASAFTKLVMDSSTVYMTSSQGGLYKVARTGGTSMEIVAGVNAGGIAVDDTRVWWTDAALGSIMRMEKAGGEPQSYLQGLLQPSLIVVGPQWLAWSDPVEHGGAVRTAPLSGGIGRSYVSQGVGEALTSGPEAAYWSTHPVENPDGTVTPGTISTAPLGYELYPQVRVLASGVQRSRGIAIDATAVYYTDYGTGEVKKVAK